MESRNTSTALQAFAISGILRKGCVHRTASVRNQEQQVEENNTCWYDEMPLQLSLFSVRLWIAQIDSVLCGNKII
jgi:hypothetical protein